MSPSRLHAAVKRALATQLAFSQDKKVVPHARNLEEFPNHGLKYVFLPERGELTRGMPTARAAPPLAQHFAPTSEAPPVWPDPEGQTRGMAFAPLYKLAPGTAREDPRIHELLVLVDAIRGGAREQQIAIHELKERLADDAYYCAGSHARPRFNAQRPVQPALSGA